jgi:hypothetical protein
MVKQINSQFKRRRLKSLQKARIMMLKHSKEIIIDIWFNFFGKSEDYSYFKVKELNCFSSFSYKHMIEYET